MPGSAYTCCLCGSEEFGYGNNPDPLGKLPKRCCDTCNYSKVIPARIEMMMGRREFSSEDTQEQAAAAIIGGIFTVSMGALLEHLGTALENEDAPAATFFKDCIDYMGMAMVSSYEDNTKNFPKEVKAAIDMTLGMTAQQLMKWEKNPSFEELTNLGSSENPNVETMTEVMIDEVEDFEDDFSVMYTAESFATEGKSFVCDACEETLPLKLRNRSLKVAQEFGMGMGNICRPCVKRIKSYEAESYADFFTQMEELLESTTDGGWTLDANTDQDDLDSVTMVVTFTPKDPSTFFDIIE